MEKKIYLRNPNNMRYECTDDCLVFSDNTNKEIGRFYLGKEESDYFLIITLDTDTNAFERAKVSFTLKPIHFGIEIINHVMLTNQNIKEEVYGKDSHTEVYSLAENQS